jgi:hypothetical protein
LALCRRRGLLARGHRPRRLPGAPLARSASGPSLGLAAYSCGGSAGIAAAFRMRPRHRTSLFRRRAHASTGERREEAWRGRRSPQPAPGFSSRAGRRVAFLHNRRAVSPQLPCAKPRPGAATARHPVPLARRSGGLAGRRRSAPARCRPRRDPVHDRPDETRSSSFMAGLGSGRSRGSVVSHAAKRKKVDPAFARLRGGDERRNDGYGGA